MSKLKKFWKLVDFSNCEILETIQVGKFHKFVKNKFVILITPKISSLENHPIFPILQFRKLSSF